MGIKFGTRSGDNSWQLPIQMMYQMAQDKQARTAKAGENQQAMLRALISAGQLGLEQTPTFEDRPRANVQSPISGAVGRDVGGRGPVQNFSVDPSGGGMQPIAQHPDFAPQRVQTGTQMSLAPTGANNLQQQIKMMQLMKGKQGMMLALEGEARRQAGAQSDMMTDPEMFNQIFTEKMKGFGALNNIMPLLQQGGGGGSAPGVGQIQPNPDLELFNGNQQQGGDQQSLAEDMAELSKVSPQEAEELIAMLGQEDPAYAAQLKAMYMSQQGPGQGQLSLPNIGQTIRR